MKSSEIRAKFLDFFKEKDHLVLPSFSLVPRDDPTLLLIGAGMAPFKPYFTGERTPPHPRVVTCQKCLRTPDIEKVGITARHATFFEMLGNFSFGDYFKEKAIAWAWELMTEGYGLPEGRLYISIYEDDDEAFTIWRNLVGIPESRIYRLGKEDNFWEIGQGPCGPCSEIYYDMGPEYGCGRPDCQVGCDCDRYLELWNLVFTQFNKEADGSYSNLTQKNIDTGAGLERLAIVLQGVSTLFEIDIVKPILDYFCGKAAVIYGKEQKTDISLRVITEHLRGVTFMASDGVMPSNEGRGYVLRRILRRAVRHGKLLGLEAPFLYKAVPLVAELMEDTYPELREKLDYLTRIVKLEEERFKETLDQGMVLLESHIDALQEKGENALSGAEAFKLYDTFGFPLDLTREILQEKGLSLHEEEFEKALEGQRKRARAAADAQQGGHDNSLNVLLKGLNVTTFTGYESLLDAAEVTGIISVSQNETLLETGAGEGTGELYLILDKSPFYAEGGGQVGDRGAISSAEGSARVLNALPGPKGQILHLVEMEKGVIRCGDKVQAVVDEKYRKDVARNHTATHLLHRALKEVLGEHVNQAGSLVEPERLRFDFTHFTHLEEDEIHRVEAAVNESIVNNKEVSNFYTSLEQALELGAVAIFDEKYGDDVRVVKVDDYSLELCGGTHVRSTGEIGLFKIVSEGGVGAGLRRIEALTGNGAYRYFVQRDNILKEAANLVKATPEKLPEKIQVLLESQKEMQRKLKLLQQQTAGQQIDRLLQETDYSLGVPVLRARVEVENMEALRQYLDQLRDKLKSGIILLGTISNGKVLLAAVVTKDLVEQGFHAGKLIGEVAKLTGGGGGGRPEMAQAGGKDPQKLSQALAEVLTLIKKQQDKSGL
jgi:alanyl-tRNA synthetase